AGEELERQRDPLALESAALEQWLHDLEPEFPTGADQVSECLVYRVRESESGRLLLDVLTSLRLADGSLSPPMPYALGWLRTANEWDDDEWRDDERIEPNAANLSEPDSRVIRLLEAQTLSEGVSESRYCAHLGGAWGADILRAAVATGRCFWSDARETP